MLVITKDNKLEKKEDLELSHLKKQVKFLEQALIPDTPEEVVKTWAQGMMNRNGALQYAMYTPELKKVAWEQRFKHSWVTGLSNPQVKNYIIVTKKEIKKDCWVFEVLLEEFATTASGNWNKVASNMAKITVRAQEERWYIAKIIIRFSIFSNDSALGVLDVSERR